MNKTFNINEGEIMILKDINYDDFLKNGNKIVINQKNLDSIYEKTSNNEIPIRLTEGSYDSKKLNENQIHTPNFKTLILGPMTKIEITYGDSKSEYGARRRSEQRISSNMVLSNLSPNSLTSYETKKFYVTDLGNSIMSIKISNERNNPNAQKELFQHNKWVKKLELNGQPAEIIYDEEENKESKCMNLGTFILYLTMFLLLIYIVRKYFNKN
jgi:hypothetical protein